MVLNGQAFSNIPHCRGCFQPASLTFLISHDCITILCHIWVDQATCAVYLLEIVAEAPWQCCAVTDPTLLRAAGGCIGERCFALLDYLVFCMRCNLKTAPNIGELSLVSAIGPLFEWNVPVLPMVSWQSQAPQTSRPYEMTDAVGRMTRVHISSAWFGHKRAWRFGLVLTLHIVWPIKYNYKKYIIIAIIMKLHFI